MDTPNQMVARGTDDGFHVDSVTLNNEQLVSLSVNGEERVCLAQLSNTLLKDYSYNEIHNRRVALGITCVQCTPFQLDVLRKAGAMPVSSRRCGMITKREAERLFKSFFNEVTPPRLPADFMFNIYHKCGWGCSGFFMPNRYTSSRAKCIKCAHCGMMFSPNKFIFHCHQTAAREYTHPDAANFNSWRRHIQLTAHQGSKEIEYAWEDVKALFNGGSRKRLAASSLDNEDEESPNKLLNSIFPPQSAGQATAGLSSIHPHPLPSHLRLPASPTIPTFSPSFPSPFLRPTATDHSMQPFWPVAQHVALNELLHRTRFLVPRPPSLAQYHQIPHSLPMNNFTAVPNTSTHTQNLSVTRSSSTADEKEVSEMKKSKETKIKRPWIDSSSEAHQEGITPKDITKPSHNSTEGVAPSISGSEQTSQALLRDFLHRMEHSML